MIKSFQRKNAFLSNFYPWEGGRLVAPKLKLKYEGIIYPSSEHAYQAAKSASLGIRRLIAKCETPGEAKKMGRTIVLRSGWEDIKYDIMDLIVWTKFEEKKLKKKLIATDPHELIEGNWWHDGEWGICYCAKCGGVGKNWLGEILMGLRDDFISDTETLEGRQ